MLSRIKLYRNNLKEQSLWKYRFWILLIFVLYIFITIYFGLYEFNYLYKSGDTIIQIVGIIMGFLLASISIVLSNTEFKEETINSLKIDKNNKGRIARYGSIEGWLSEYKKNILIETLGQFLLIVITIILITIYNNSIICLTKGGIEECTLDSRFSIVLYIITSSLFILLIFNLFKLISMFLGYIEKTQFTVSSKK